MTTRKCACGYDVYVCMCVLEDVRVRVCFSVHGVYHAFRCNNIVFVVQYFACYILITDAQRVNICNRSAAFGMLKCISDLWTMNDSLRTVIALSHSDLAQTHCGVLFL